MFLLTTLLKSNGWIIKDLLDYQTFVPVNSHGVNNLVFQSNVTVRQQFASGVTAEESGSIVGGKLCAGEAGGAQPMEGLGIDLFLVAFSLSLSFQFSSVSFKLF